MASEPRKFAIVTGASTGIGFELARQCLDHGFDVLIAADEPAIEEAAARLRPRPAVVIVLTDGFTPWPQRPPPRTRVVVGVLTERGAPFEFPLPDWARIVRIEDG